MSSFGDLRCEMAFSEFKLKTFHSLHMQNDWESDLCVEWKSEGKREGSFSIENYLELCELCPCLRVWRKMFAELLNWMLMTLNYI